MASVVPWVYSYLVNLVVNRQYSAPQRNSSVPGTLLLLMLLMRHLGRCHLLDVMVEMDRILRPEGTVVIRDSPEVIKVIFNVARAVRWTATIHEQEPESHANEQIMVATKPLYKPSSASQ